MKMPIPLNLTPEEQTHIKIQAKAIDLLEQYGTKLLAADQEIGIQIGNGRLTLRIQLINPTSPDWNIQLLHSIFWPLFEQGYEKYLEALKHIAETGEL